MRKELDSADVSKSPNLGRESFAAIGPLALFGIAFYPVLVHRPTVSSHASFSQSVALMK